MEVDGAGWSWVELGARFSNANRETVEPQENPIKVCVMFYNTLLD